MDINEPGKRHVMENIQNDAIDIVNKLVSKYDTIDVFIVLCHALAFHNKNVRPPNQTAERFIAIIGHTLQKVIWMEEKVMKKRKRKIRKHKTATALQCSECGGHMKMVNADTLLRECTRCGTKQTGVMNA